MIRLQRCAAWLAVCAACGDDTSPAHDAATDAGVVSADAAPAEAPPAVTYWGHVAPLFEAHCLDCHREAGIGPFRLDTYADAKPWADAIALATAARTMPPWSVTSDGSCGEFQGSLALSDAEIALLAAWVAAGAPEGTPGSLALPEPQRLSGAQTYTLPAYAPEVAGGPLAQSDDYHCFELDPGVDALRFITGYEVLPGTPAIVHHVVLAIVDPEAPAEDPAPPGSSNAARMAALDAETPDRVGWPCFALAGDGVSVTSVPIVWAPGQGIVRLPGNSGVPLQPGQRLVAQLHYNLADPAQRGQTDQSAFKLALSEAVDNVGLFGLVDPLLDSLNDPVPASLPPGRPSARYTWRRGMAELGLTELPAPKLWGVMPHMHQRGHTYQLRVKPAGGALSCAADVRQWDFHWQRMFFFAEPYALDADSAFEVTCDYDTSADTAPVLPGWGTRNEMCLATFYLTVPAAALGL